ncbi:MAG: dockerin type I domain-containing protein [Rubripirellula sp.]
MSLLPKWTRFQPTRDQTRRDRSKRDRRRALCCEPLEVRRLLIAEAAPFSFNGTYDAAGVVGNVSAQVAWGDGTTTPVDTITGGNQTGDLRIRLDYSLDTAGFFSGANQSRRALLQIAADSLIQRFGDDLAAIAPGGDNTWEASVFHPSQGAAGSLAGNLHTLPANPQVAANEIIIYAGGRNLPGNNRGVGGPASFRFPSANLSCQSQAECDQRLAAIETFRNIVRGRGESGALANPQTDVAPHIGSVSFDTDTDWFFNANASGMAPGQVDFISVATHEIAHVLGFGITRTDVTTSWARLSSGGQFSGAAARAAYDGSGNPPTVANHWGPSIVSTVGQPILMSGSIPVGQRQLFTPLDFAAMDDMGWELLNSDVTIASGTHRFPDDGDYPVQLLINGSRSGQVVHDIQTVNVTNVAPTLTAVGTQTVQVGQSLSINDIVQITDPGFRNLSGDPITNETFSYTINWGDGGDVVEGTATIDAHGTAAGTTTNASFDGSRTYDSVGNKTVTVQVMDDDGGTAQQTFTVQVTAPPTLSLVLDAAAIDENSGAGAASLTVRRSGPALDANQTITLNSSDTTEATVPATAVILAGDTEVSVPVAAVDDALLDGDVTLQLTASATGLDPAGVDLVVRDVESLLLTLSFTEVQEDLGSTFSLVVQRSNTNIDEELSVNISGGDSAQFDIPTQTTIPAGADRVVLPVMPIDDDVAELTQTLTYTFSATNYESATAQITILDDEPPLFQNPADDFDVNNNGSVTANDALVIINRLASRGGPADLNPASEQPNGVFLDPNGDYRLTALDALVVINEVGRRRNAGETEELAMLDFDRKDELAIDPWYLDLGSAVVSASNQSSD